MKSVLACLLLLFAVATASAQTEQTGWEEFAPEGGGFSMLFPTKPVETITAKPNYTMHSFATTSGRATYVASYTDYEQIKLGPAAFLAANRDRFNKGLQAKLVSSREITVDGHTGIEFTSENPAANIRSQLFLIGKRMFQTASVVFKDTDQTREVNRFFSSFKFIKSVAYLTTPSSGLDALAYSRRGIRPATYASRPA
ncbi:MAG TPA: hypothetical protein VM941_12810 [Pyrinomonadaceae bacterium]|nr:hypothetical protein [Pyrinomonadaceae bacterium]